jgi:hypothetical protein
LDIPSFVANRISNATKRGASVFCIILAGLLLMINYNLVFEKNEPFVSQFPPDVLRWITVLAVTNMIAMATLLLAQTILTPEVIEPKCPFCKATMFTKTLKCTNCGKESG